MQFPWVCKWIYIHTFHYVWLGKCGLRVLNMMQLSICWFHEKWHRLSPTSLMGINSVKFMCVLVSSSALLCAPPPSHLDYTWGPFLSTIMSIVVFTRMGRLLLLYVPQTSHYFHYFFWEMIIQGIPCFRTKDYKWLMWWSDTLRSTAFD